MNKRWNLMRGALAALVCLAMVLVWVPEEAMAADDEIHVKVLYSNLLQYTTPPHTAEEETAKLIQAIYENDTTYLTTKNLKVNGIGTYKGHPIKTTIHDCTRSFDAINNITADNTQLLIIITPNQDIRSYGGTLKAYLENGGCIWLCGEHYDYDNTHHGGNINISNLSASLNVHYSLNEKATILALGEDISGELSDTQFSDSRLESLDKIYLAKLNSITDSGETIDLGKTNDHGEYSHVMLVAANNITYTDPRFTPVITYDNKIFMIDAPVEKGYLTISADENLLKIKGENGLPRATPWAPQILYNFLDRSVESIEAVAHTHNWEYTADGSTLYAYCIQEPDADKQSCAYFVEQADRENGNYKAKAVKINTSTPNVDYTGDDYDQLKQEEHNFDVTQLGIKDVKNTYYKADEKGEPKGDPLPGAPSEVGSYVLVATLEVNGKTLKAKSTFKINPVEAPPTVTARDYTGVYDGQPHSITVTAPAGANVTYSTDGINYSAANPAYTNAGTYTVHYDVDGAKGTAAVRITPRTVSIRWSEEAAFRYTGEPQAPAAGVEGLLPSDACEVEVSGAQTEPGEYTAEAVRLSNPNYRLPTSGTTQEFRIIRASTSAPSTPSYPIIVRDEAPEGGLVRASRDWSHRGSTITVTAEPLEGYRLEQVTAVTRDGKSLRLTEKEGSGCKYTFTMPADKVFVEAVFSREETASTAGTGGEDAPAEPEIHAVSESPAVPEGTALTCPGVTACPIWPYFDANPSAWYHDGVHYCLETGLMTGYDDATFRPRDTVSRAEALVMLWRLRGSPAADSAPAFMDVSEAAWYAGAVRWAASESIVLGTGTGRFAPGEMLTHRQLNTILQRCAQSMGLEPPALMGEDPAALVSRAQAAVALADFAQNTLK